MDLGVYLVRRGVITADQYVDACERQLDSRRKLGELALTYHKLSMKQVMELLEDQIELPLPFGQLAVQKGYLTDSQLLELLGLQTETCPSIADVLVEQKALTKRKLQQEIKRYRNERAESSLVAQEA
jgi:hypothetical protein